MSVLSSFSSNKKFHEEKHFPYGIARSGEFNKSQATLLETYGVAYQELHSGVRKPVNKEEIDFVSVCLGNKKANTQHEIAWMRYCQKIEERKTLPTLRNTRMKDEMSDSTSIIQDFR